ncbi:hypothetical protein SK224_13640 [Microbacterium sp. BG28]|nr:hypothetical protein [Microbacterium sp. BG28]MDY0830171.1 hypothetical protein [Microbacterium sp. BG28]
MSLASAAAWAAAATQGLPWVWGALGLVGFASLVTIVVRGRRERE